MAVALALVNSIRGFEQFGPLLESYIVGTLREVAGKDVGIAIRTLLQRAAEGHWGLLSAGVLFVTSFKLFLDVEVAVNRIFRTPRERSWWRRILLILGFYILVPFGLSIFLGLRSMGLLKGAIQSAPWISDWLIACVAMTALIRWLPARRPPWRAVWAGALCAATGLFVLGKTYAWVAKTFFVFNKVYGSLAAFPLLCLWILWAWQITLFGVAITASWPHPRSRTLTK